MLLGVMESASRNSHNTIQKRNMVHKLPTHRKRSVEISNVLKPFSSLYL